MESVCCSEGGPVTNHDNRTTSPPCLLQRLIGASLSATLLIAQQGPSFYQACAQTASAPSGAAPVAGGSAVAAGAAGASQGGTPASLVQLGPAAGGLTGLGLPYALSQRAPSVGIAAPVVSAARHPLVLPAAARRSAVAAAVATTAVQAGSAPQPTSPARRTQGLGRRVLSARITEFGRSLFAVPQAIDGSLRAYFDQGLRRAGVSEAGPTVPGKVPRPRLDAPAGLRHGTDLSDAPALSLPERSDYPFLKELKAVLSGGTLQADGQRVRPFGFKQPSGRFAKARSAGLEGFYVSKLEHERAFGEEVALGQLEDYFRYLDALLAPMAWAAGLRAEFAAIAARRVPPLDAKRALDAALLRAVRGLRSRAAELDQSLWLRRANIYMVFARAYNRLRPGQGFFESFDDAEFERIRREVKANVVWLQDVFEIGEIRRWGTGGGSPYSIKGYRVKPELGGDEAFRAFVARAKAAGLRVAVDVIPNHISLDSDLTQAHPEALFHIVPPQPEPGEDVESYKARILSAAPREQGGHHSPVFYPVFTLNYPGREGVGLWILVHHPRTDYGDVMWVDMAQRDYSRRVARDWEVGEVRRLFAEIGVDLVRRDMAYYVLNAGYYHRWLRILEDERDSVSGWAREEMDRLIAGFKSRWAELGGTEILEEMTDAVKAARPDGALIDELYAYFSDISPYSDAGYNKNDQDLEMGEHGLYDRLPSGDAAGLRAALRRMAFAQWQRGGAGLVTFAGNHDESNPVDKFGDVYRFAVAMTMLLRPTLTYNGFERGVGQKEGLIGDLSRSVDLNKDIPYDIPVRLNWEAKDPARAAFVSAVLSLAERNAELLAEGSVEVYEPQQPGPIVAWSAARADDSGRQRAVLVAGNASRLRGDAKDWARIRFGEPLLEDFGAFRPRSDRRYVFKDYVLLDHDGSPTVYEFSGLQLLQEGLVIGLPPGNVHLFEVEELEESAPTTGPPAGRAQATKAGEGRRAAGDLGTALRAWLAVPWGVWVERGVLVSLIPFLFLQMPQILTNFANLAADPSKIGILPWIGYATGILANMNLLSYHVEGRRHTVAAVQLVGLLTSAVVLAQIFLAGFVPQTAALVMPGIIAVGLGINVLKWLGKLPASVFGVDPWKAFNRLSVLLGLFALPLGFSVTFDLMSSHRFGVLAASFALAGLGAAAMALDGLGKLPRRAAAVWGTLGAWLGTLLFLFLPIPQLVNNFAHPEQIAGLAVGTLLLSTFGNALQTAGALWHKNRIWFAGSFWAISVGGWGVLLSLFLLGAVSPALFWVFTLAVPASLGWVLRRSMKARGETSYRQALKFLVTTWDYDGVAGTPRELRPEPADYAFGAGRRSQ